MKNRFKNTFILNPKIFGRAAIVLIFSGICAFLLGEILRQGLNSYYMATGSATAQNLFYFLSLNRYTLIFVGCLIMLLVLAGWIMRPAFDSFAHVIKESINISGDNPEPVKLPKDFKNLEEELNDVNKEIRLWRYTAREAEQRKDDLVVYLAHDIRTPLTSVIGYLELLRDNPDLPQESQIKFTDIAFRKAQRMQTLVEELFEITRFNVGQVEIEQRDVNILMLMRQLVEEITPQFESKKITADVIDEGTGQVFIDGEKMARALDNILQNAYRYTPENGTVTVNLSNTDNGRCKISVTNTGTHIPQEKLDRLFEKFYRGDEARQSSTGGSGLGLAIAKNIVEAHGGTICARSDEKETTFEIII